MMLTPQSALFKHHIRSPMLTSVQTDTQKDIVLVFAPPSSNANLPVSNLILLENKYNPNFLNYTLEFKQQTTLQYI